MPRYDYIIMFAHWSYHVQFTFALRQALSQLYSLIKVYEYTCMFFLPFVCWLRLADSRHRQAVALAP